ncbi:unnamed protein product (macronuclear) [Paramecium tetraurelia]|uniref:PPM-type phosphatase domain-containing protein n=1 Tax=Paramecium tetraurelia TaxID=5888 RepID=A0D9I8_PARTE|nr:uncharacterized protein GSPATT00014635001 [Paramecium tetraurelia]CAK79705.1 unnamed protein product [Paramecium tetraurelia]|eukprot:XP_001447102.1 hypothetical protein (macronuclear) [Paramecium tetraurelia strain d4-2]
MNSNQTNNQKKPKPKLQLNVNVVDVQPESTHSSNGWKQQTDIFFNEPIDQFVQFQHNGKTVADVAQLKCGRRYQEDRFVGIPNLNINQEMQFFYAIYDGHAGHSVSAILENKLHEYLQKDCNFEDNLEKAIINSFERMNQYILDCQEENHHLGGSTALCVINKHKDLYVVNLGDSACVLITEELQIEKLNSEHKLNREDEFKRVEQIATILDRHSIPRINGELAVTRAFGDKKHRQSGLIAIPEIKVHKIQANDKYLILASDGFWDLIKNEELQKLIENWNRKEIDQLAQYLLDKASSKNTNYKKDNMTLIVIDIQSYWK